MYNYEERKKKFIKSVEDRDGYTLVNPDQFINSKTHVDMRHDKCGHIYKVIPNSFMRGRGCPKCKGGVSYSYDMAKSMIGDVDGYTLISKTYKNAGTPIRVKHDVCGYEYDVRLAQFNFGNRCPKCAGTLRKTLEEVKNRICDLVGDEYEVLSTKYINNKTPMTLKHNICGGIYDVIIKDFLRPNGSRCPYCARSLGEEKVAEVLDKLNISYETQFKIPECRNKYVLSFDFKVYLDDNYILIEYDGELHYNTWDDTEKSKIHLQKQKHNDDIKTKYCYDNDIELLRIPYWEYDNIENILVQRLSKPI